MQSKTESLHYTAQDRSFILKKHNPVTHPRYTWGRAAQVFAPLHWAPRNTIARCPLTPYTKDASPMMGQTNNHSFYAASFIFFSVPVTFSHVMIRDLSTPPSPLFAHQNLPFVLSPAKTCQVKETHSFSCLWLTASFPAWQTDSRHSRLDSGETAVPRERELGRGTVGVQGETSLGLNRSVPPPKPHPLLAACEGLPQNAADEAHTLSTPLALLLSYALLRVRQIYPHSLG